MPENLNIHGNIINPHKNHGAQPFCDCEFPNCTKISSFKGNIPDLINCRCGEDIKHSMEWKWEQNDNDVLISGPDVTFHPVYSQGTVIIRGEKPLKPFMIHFWEIRIITAMSGTDVMLGIGTDKINLDQYKFHFVSALGSNDQSWGFSYNGVKQYNGERISYGNSFNQGCIIGIYLDLSQGYLEFFLNRRSLGIAYKNIPVDPNIRIYPMVCSTAAKSSIRLLNSTSQLDCLQLRAFQSLSKIPQHIEELRQMPGLKRIMETYWFFIPPIRYSPRSSSSSSTSSENEIDIIDEAILSSSRLSRKKKFKAEEDFDFDGNNDLYWNAHKIPMHNRNDSDDEISLDEFLHFLF